MNRSISYPKKVINLLALFALVSISNANAQSCQSICNQYAAYARSPTTGPMNTYGPLQQLYQACMACQANGARMSFPNGGNAAAAGLAGTVITGLLDALTSQPDQAISNHPFVDVQPIDPAGVAAVQQLGKNLISPPLIESDLPLSASLIRQSPDLGQELFGSAYNTKSP